MISGRLLRPFADELRLTKTYWIICPNATASLPKIVTFRDWLVAEAAQDRRSSIVNMERIGSWNLDMCMR